MHLLRNPILKIQFIKTSLALTLSIILSYLLAFVRLTWQVDNGWFSPLFDIFFMEFINIGAAFIRALGRRGTGVGGDGKG